MTLFTKIIILKFAVITKNALHDLKIYVIIIEHFIREVIT